MKRIADKYCSIAVMAKASKPGRTKTRLSPPLTPEEAAQFNTAFLKDIAANLISASETASLTGAMAYGPPGDDGFFREHLPDCIVLHEVWYPNFGECLQRALDAQFAAGHEAAGVLNSDSPTLPAELLLAAIDALDQPGDRVVIGPSNDGGYYFLGCKVIHPRLFQDIRWSTEFVMAETLERAAEAGVEVHVLPEWYDVDDAAALKLLIDEVVAGRPFHSGFTSSPAVHSAALIHHLLANAQLDQRLNRHIEASASRTLESAAA